MHGFFWRHRSGFLFLLRICLVDGWTDGYWGGVSPVGLGGTC